MQIRQKQIEGLEDSLKAPITVSDTPPSSPINNQLWIDSTNMSFFVYLIENDVGNWVEVS